MNDPSDARDALPGLHPPLRLREPDAPLPIDAARGIRYAPPPAAPAPVAAAGQARGAQTDADLLSPTIRWLARMPPDVRPKLLMERFPRVVNLLWALRRQPERFHEYMAELMFYERGNSQRAGFPAEAVRELLVLRTYYDKLQPEERDR